MIMGITQALYGMVEDSRAQDCVQDMAGFSAIVGKTSNTTALSYIPAVQVKLLTTTLYLLCRFPLSVSSNLINL